MASTSQSPGLNIRHPFHKAQDDFLRALSPDERAQYLPCPSTKHLLALVSHYATHRISENRILQVINHLNDSLAPYFKVVDTFISSNPDCAALIWGTIRLIFQLASNFASFFERLTSLLDDLSNSFRQYGLILDLCSADIDIYQTQIPSILEAVYSDVLQIFHQIIKVFTKRDGRLKNTATVIGDLLWKPFNSRFKTMLEALASHRKSLFEEINIWHVSSTAKESARTAAELSLVHNQSIETKRERELSQEERHLMQIERQQATDGRRETRECFGGIRDALKRIECELFEINCERIRNWVSAPIFTDAKESAAKLRHRDTTAWIFKEPEFMRWLSHDLKDHDDIRRRKSNVLWIYGNPGSGKTVLASSIIDRLAGSSSRSNEVYYYFFEHKSRAHNSACSAYRSILAQVLSRHWDNPEVLDKFAFIMYDHARNQNQLAASESILLELVQLSMSKDTFLILDGVDECEDSENFVASLANIWSFHLPSILVLSRVYVHGLRQFVPEGNRLEITKELVASDIRLFSAYQLRILFDDGMIPENGRSQIRDLEDRLVTGADGMFLWVRLLINFIRSPYMYPEQRLHYLNQISTPEGLEVMYGRIVELIQRSGNYCESLASKVFTRLLYATCPISTRQLHQALVVDEIIRAGLGPDPISVRNFEDSVIMACTGLVERATLHNPSFLHEEPSLRLIHLSANEILIQNHSIPYLNTLTPTPALKLIPDIAIASLDGVTNSLKQILFNTPAHVLSGDITQPVSAVFINNMFCYSDYAAVSWLSYIRTFVSAVPANPMLYNQQSAAFSQSLAQFTSALETFLRSPPSLSVWLEIFYTTGYHEINPQDYTNPSTAPLDALAQWGKRMRIPYVGWPICDELITNIEAFGAELRDAVALWGLSLREKPHVVWDEFSGFLSTNRFFWSSGSTKIFYQQLVSPTGAPQPQEPAALLSRTSETGQMKAVLSIWANIDFQDSSIKDKAWSNVLHPFDLTSLCTGWRATYEIWRLYPENALLGTVNVALQPWQLLIPMRNYLYHRDSQHANLPMAIKSDLSGFTVLESLFVLQQDSSLSSSTSFSTTMPLVKQGNDCFMWTRPPADKYHRPAEYFTTFSDKMSHVAILQWQESGEQILTVFEYRLDHGIKTVMQKSMTFSTAIMKIEKVIFHPKRSIVSFCTFWKYTPRSRNKVYIWPYQIGSAEILELNQGFTMEAVGYSNCGNYFLVKEKFRQDSLIVVPISQALQSWVSVGCSNPGMNTSNDGSLLRLSPHHDQLSVISASSAHVDPDGRVSSTLVQASEGGISLYQSGASTQTWNLTHLPTWQGVSETTQTIIPPQSGDDSLKISVDVNTQGLSPASAYQLSRAGGSIRPSVIHRDLRFVNIHNPIAYGTGTNMLSPIGPRTGVKRTLTDAGIEDEDFTTRHFHNGPWR